MTEVQVFEEKAVVATAGQDAMLSMIERLASNPDVDINKMQALVDMRNQEIARVDNQHQAELARIAKQEFNIDYVEMSGELPLVVKTKNNTHTKSKYAALDDINRAIQPVLSKYGFSITSNVLEQAKELITVEVTLVHKGGHEKSIKLAFPLDNKGSGGTVNKTEIHATASTIMYARRIGECTLLNISTGDDTDGNQNKVDEFATDAQRTAISGLYRLLDDNQKKSFDELTGGLFEIKRNQFDKVMSKLRKTIGDKDAGNN